MNIGIIGGAGYTGGELIRILLRHPNASISFVHSRSNAGKPVSAVHRDLTGETELFFTAETDTEQLDVLFLCLGHGESKKYLSEHTFPSHLRIIDLTNDFRMSVDGVRPEYNGLPFVYGLPELNKEIIQSSRLIANPGCFATAIQLGLLPLAKAGVLKDVFTTGITGSTGAGQGFSETSHFSWRHSNIQAYKTLSHQHIPEIKQGLKQISGKEDAVIHFVPWRGDFTRGIFISSQLQCALSKDEIKSLYHDYYQSHPFTSIISESLFLKQVVNTNKCLIQIEKSGDQLVIHSAIDNLLKGAVGQAVQNMNLMLGIDETAGLKLKASYF
jgi:N-acetyl-gamma-glutamyl-phosphate reductase